MKTWLHGSEKPTLPCFCFVFFLIFYSTRNRVIVQLTWITKTQTACVDARGPGVPLPGDCVASINNWRSGTQVKLTEAPVPAIQASSTPDDLQRGRRWISLCPKSQIPSTSLLPASACNTGSQQPSPAETNGIICAQIHQHSEILSHSLHCNVSPINPNGEMTQPGSDTVLYHRVPRHLCGLLQSMQQEISVLSCK